MGAKTDYLENKLLDFRLRGQVYTPPATVYVGLFTSLPGDNGAAGVEVTGGGYARVAVACTLANWAGTQGAGTTAVSSGSSGSTSNNNIITFPTATLPWGTIVGGGLWDAPTGGNMTDYGTITTTRPIYAGDIPQILAGQLVIQEDD